MTRLLMTADSLGGVWTYALELARALAPHGFQTTVATMGGPLTPEQRGEAAQIPSLRTFESSYKLEWMADPWRDIDEAACWLRWIRDLVQPDVVHLNNYMHGGLEWRAPVVMVGHSCVVSWWRAVCDSEPPSSWQRYRDEVKRGLSAADLVVAPSAAMLASLQDNYGPLTKTRVISNGRYLEPRTEARKQQSILMAGRLWDQGKNVHALCRIAPHLSWPVYVAGDTGGECLPNCVTLGRLSPGEMAAEYRRASIYALPARYEPFGLSVLEAALSGCALVLSDIPSLRENWEDAAIFVPPADEEGLAREINGLISDPARLAQLRFAAEGRALQFTAERMAASYVDAYREAAVHAAREFLCAW